MQEDWVLRCEEILIKEEDENLRGSSAWVVEEFNLV